MPGVKGQLVFEFVIVAVIFFIIIVYIISYLNLNVSAYSADFYAHDLEDKALKISELISHSNGSWTDSTPEVIGFALKWPVVNMTKVGLLDSYCSSNYIQVVDKLDLLEKPYPVEKPRYDLKIRLENETYVFLDCGPAIPNITLAKVQRFCLYKNYDTGEYDTLKLKVWVW